MARSPYLLFKYISSGKITYYVKIRQSTIRNYTIAKITDIITDELGIDRKLLP
jgi:hypothetical protein